MKVLYDTPTEISNYPEMNHYLNEVAGYYCSHTVFCGIMNYDPDNDSEKKSLIDFCDILVFTDWDGFISYEVYEDILYAFKLGKKVYRAIENEEEGDFEVNEVLEVGIYIKKSRLEHGRITKIVQDI
jgi:hypothetical protein